MLKVLAIYYEYPSVLALSDVSFELEKNSITALVGPNGAGKSTLMRCIAALDAPLSGFISVNGLDTAKEPRKCHREIGYLSDFFGLYNELTVRQCLQHASLMRGVPLEREKEVLEKTATNLSIEGLLNKTAGNLSRGQRQRLAIGQAMIHEPSLLVLDEPASGLDPEARHSLSELFVNLKKLGMTLLVSSHILSELEDYSDHMIILEKGQVVSHESLKSSSADREVLFVKSLSNRDLLKKVLIEQEELSITSEDSEGIIFEYNLDEDKQAELLKSLINKGLDVVSFGKSSINMHDTYLNRVASSRDFKVIKDGDGDNNE